MPRLTIVVDVSDDVDPKLEDPHVIADDIVESYNDCSIHNGIASRVKMVSAEWVGDA
jgi:hypothetical protein